MRTHPTNHCLRILDAISPEHDTNADDAEEYESAEPAPIIIGGNGNHLSTHSGPNYDRYLRALTPLLELEKRLTAQLADPEDNEEHEPTHLPMETYNGGHSSSSSLSTGPPNGATYGNGPNGEPIPRILIPAGSRSLPTSPTSTSIGNGDEPSVRAASGWKKHFALGKISSQSQKDAYSGELRGWWEDPNDPVHVLNRCAPYMTQLWRDPAVRHRLQERRLRLEESSGLYVLPRPFLCPSACVSALRGAHALPDG